MKRRKRLGAGLWAAAFLGCALMPAAALAAPDGSGTDASGQIVFSARGISAADETGISIEGTSLEIRSSGRYEVTGMCPDGSIKVARDVKDVVLVLDGLDLTSTTTAPIVCSKGSGVMIEAAAGSENRLADTEANNDETHTENLDAENAVIKCKDGSQVVICGTGSIEIEAKGKNGIKSGATTEADGEASLVIQDLSLAINASVNDGINAEQLLAIPSGNVSVSALDDGIHSDLALNIGAEGSDGPTIDVLECEEGLEAANLAIMSGDIRIAANDDCLNAANSDLAGYAFTMDISGGSIYAVSQSGDGFDSNGTLTISDGDVEVWTGNAADNQPLDADGKITISGGTILAAGGSSGMGMRSLDAAQAYVEFGSAGGGFPGGNPGTPPGEPGERPSGAPGPMPSFDPGAAPPGGQPSAMPSLDPGATPPGGMPGEVGIAIAQNASLAICDAAGSALCEATAPCEARYVFFSSSALDAGASYTLKANGEELGTKAAQTGSSSGRPGMPGLPAGVLLKTDSAVSIDNVDGASRISGYELSRSNPVTVDDLEDQFELLRDGVEESVVSKDGATKDGNAALATGDMLRFHENGQTIFEGTVVVAGDVLGTGTVSLAQLVAMASSYNGVEPLRGAYLAAGDFGGTGAISLSDLVREASIYRA